ncbi:MAG: transcriptional repressor LexA [Ignavibacteriaceae bacterium]|nr:transcriptional repressor LexA [Ignavibacteriaceae bacterium]
MSKELTEIQKKILEFIAEYRSETGRPPSLAEIAEKFGYKNRSTVREHLQALERKGYIKRENRISRGIDLTLEEKMFVSKPVIGEVAAGNPLSIYPDAIDTVDLPSVIRIPRESFLLRVRGESLKDAYIFSGDIVIVNPNIEPQNGQIIAAVLDEGAVVKRFYRKSGKIELVSENPDYKPIIIENDYNRFTIVGVVIGVYRNMERKPGQIYS